ncbi:Clock-controlled protein 6 [Metarhizium anisopliae]|nr:Clock-controlled protein 6 [Metarhizium anisopliae]
MNSLRMVVLGSAVASASAIAGVHNNSTATGHIVYTTEVVTALTTYCPAPTTLTHGDKTYTITSATTLTITDCPCTISKPVQPTAVPTAPAGVSTTAAVVPSGPGATTAAPSKPVSPTVVPAPAPGCNDKCQAAYDQCRGQSGANLSTCVSNFEGCKASCTGASASAPAPPPAPAPTAAKPSGNSTTPVTAGAGALAPAKVLLALGAIALL